jgi:hypothetical protein
VRRGIDIEFQMGAIGQKEKLDLVQGTFDQQFAAEQATLQKQIALQDSFIAQVAAKREELAARIKNVNAEVARAMQVDLDAQIKAQEAAIQKREQLTNQLGQIQDMGATGGDTNIHGGVHVHPQKGQNLGAADIVAMLQQAKRLNMAF